MNCRIIALATVVSTALCFAGDRTADRTASGGQSVTVYLALDQAADGFSAVKNSRGGVVYVANEPAFAVGDVVSVGRARGALTIELSAESVTTLASLNERHANARLAVFVGKELLAAPAIRGVLTNGRVKLEGLSDRTADRLLEAIEGEMDRSGGPMITAVPRESEILPGETVTVDIFARDLADIRGYQISVAAVGGRKGTLTLLDIEIDTARSDYVFEGMQSFQAADDSQQRLANALMSDGITTEGEVYLGSFILQASEDAGGLFDLVIRGGGNSIVLDSQRQKVKFRTKSTSPVEVR